MVCFAEMCDPLPSSKDVSATAEAMPGAIHGAPMTAIQSPEVGTIRSPPRRLAARPSIFRATVRTDSCTLRGVRASNQSAGSDMRASGERWVAEGRFAALITESDTTTVRAPMLPINAEPSPSATRWIPVGRVIAEP